MSVEDAVRATSAAWDAALIANDADAVGAFMAEDWVYVGPDGAATKADIVGWIGTGHLRHDSMDAVGEVRFIGHGGTAVLVGRKRSSGVWEGQAYEVEEWISEVYVQDGDRWVCVFSQRSPVEQPAQG